MTWKRSLLLILIPGLLLGAALFVGRYPIHPTTVIRILTSRVMPQEPTWPKAAETVIWEIRLPRAMLAVLVGGGLSISGAAFQGMFRNPLVSPDILGVSASAGFGACLAILLGMGPTGIQICALVMGLVGVILTCLLSRVHRPTPTLMLVLSGIIVGAFFSSLISAVKYLADPYENLPAITFWLMGSLASASTGDVKLAAPGIILGSLGLCSLGWRLNVLSMGDEEARSLGIPIEILKGQIIALATLATASAVCVVGIIGWVGLVIPHVGRMLAGPDHRVLLPASFSLGAGYLLIIDTLARAATQGEIPLGILTAIIGAPFLAWLIRRTKGAWTCP